QLPRFAAPGRPDLLLKDVRAVSEERIAVRTKALAETAKYLRAADDALAAEGKAVVTTLAKTHDLHPDVLRGWLDVLGIGTGGPVAVTGHFTTTIADPKYPFVTGWGSH